MLPIIQQRLRFFQPSSFDEQSMDFLFLVNDHVQIATDAYEAAKDSHAIVICTEWDEFKVDNKLNYFLLNIE